MNELKAAWEAYLRNAEDAALLGAIERYSIPLAGDCDYPFAHRICDVQIDAAFYRVVRLADEAETVYIYPCDTPSPRGGVPYWLQGEKLRRWVLLESRAQEEDDYDPEGETDWDGFR